MTTILSSNPIGTTKICPRCKEEKKLTPAVFKYKKGRAVYCRPCYNKYMKGGRRTKGLYTRDPVTKKTSLTDEQRRNNLIASRKKTNKKRLEWARNYVKDILTKSSCMDCGYSNWLALDFDHREPGKKYAGISDLVYMGIKSRLIEEIPKCDVVCANCHRIRTAEMFGSWRTMTD